MSEIAQVKRPRLAERNTMNYTMRVLVNGKAATQYNHDGDVYMEGRPGSTYELELRNNTKTDAEFVVSVDGLSILDGKPAGADSTGYIVSAWQTVRIKGWKVDSDIAAAFKFGSKAKSYAAVSEEGDVQNTGVMGLLVFPRKHVPTIYPDYQPYWYTKGLSGNDTMLLGAPRGLVPQEQMKSSSRRITLNASNVSQTQASFTSGQAVGMTAYDPAGAATQEYNSSLGTEFGEATNFKTTKVEFTRQSETPSYKFVMYYGDAKDLNKLGIVLDWQKTTPKKPQAFPADGCKPPKGWNGQ